MRNDLHLFLIICLPLAVSSCTSENRAKVTPRYQDIPFVQNYSIKYEITDEKLILYSVATDRNGYIQVFSSDGVLRLNDGQHLYPGSLVKDIHYRPLTDKKISATGTYQKQLVYLDENAVFSNSWAGTLFSKHGLPGAKIFAGGKDFMFLVSDGRKMNFIRNSELLWKGSMNDEVKEIKYDAGNDLFWIRDAAGMVIFSPADFSIERVMSDINITCFEIAEDILIAGTAGGYFEIDTRTREKIGDIHNRLPWNELTTVREIKGDIWFGSKRGAFMLREDGKFNYYASRRWLPSDEVVDIAEGPDNSVLILTGKGLGKICFKEMTLYDKAMYFENQVRERHIRNGFNATVTGMVNGDITTGSLEDSDNDGLWTSMYLAGQAFRYSVTSSEEALQNIRESLDAMERLYTINKIPGFPSRSFERRGYKYDDKAWRRADDPEWDWKSTTSSDEAIGHIFAFGVIAELVDETALREKAIMLIDTLMSHVVDNDFYLIDWNGEPTLWGKWNPEYVNARPVMVGDRKLNSSNIVGMLQTAFNFTGKEKYKDAAIHLMTEHGYFENLMRPVKEIGRAPEEADDWSKMLSESWNHSDDEMYFCGYWGLYRYALNDTLKAGYREAILDHWESERAEKDGLWNIMAYITGISDTDIEEAIWYLQEYPPDLINWSVTNSHRKDIEFIDNNFRHQTIREVLPPDELPVSRHNANRFIPDGNGEGKSEYSAGDIWLLPYWMGRYLGVIGAAGINRTGTGKH